MAMRLHWLLEAKEKMDIFKILWGFLFRLFPCPVKTGLYRIGDPGPDSPVLVTCNFDLTVRRLLRILKELDLWFLVADSKGINVWCAAGANEFNTQSVVSVVKTSNIVERVNHRTLILPPLGAPGIKRSEVKAMTGWKVKWGPVRAEDIPRYIRDGLQRTEQMKRVTYNLKERLDTALGAVFIFYLLGGIGFLLFGRFLLVEYLLIGPLGFFLFFGLCPYLPGKNGIAKALVLDAILAAVFLALETFWDTSGLPVRRDFILLLIFILLSGLELGGLASTMPSALDPVLAKMGIKKIGNIPIAGEIRIELLAGEREIQYTREACKGCRSCVEICPQGVWELDHQKKASMTHAEKCTACCACLVQCEGGAIQAPKCAVC